MGVDNIRQEAGNVAASVGDGASSAGKQCEECDSKKEGMENNGELDTIGTGEWEVFKTMNVPHSIYFITLLTD